MKKLAYTAALALMGVALGAPAMANIYGEQRTTCRTDADGAQHCWVQRSEWQQGERWRDERQFVALHNNEADWYDGSVRATLPPHAARGPASRPDMGDSGWFTW